MAETVTPFNFDSFPAPAHQPDRRKGSSFGGRRKTDQSEHALDAEALRAELEMLREQQQQELTRTRQEAFQAGIDHARTERDAAILSSIDALGAALEDAAADRESLIAEYSQDAAGLALVAAEAIAGHATGIAPSRAIDEGIGRVLAQLARGEEIQVAVHPELAEDIQRRIEAREAGNRKRISLTVVEDEAIAPGDAVLTWDRGGISINAEARKAAIIAELEPLLAGPKG